MFNLIYFLVGLIQFCLAVFGTRMLRQHFSWYMLFVLLVIYALVYDNWVIAAGVWLGESPLTLALSWPRFALHALLTPVMIISSFGALRLAGVRWAQSRPLHAVICILATALIGLGFYKDILHLDLVPELADGVVRYTNAFQFLPGPPIPPIVTILFLIGFGGVLWRVQKWPWLFVGGLLMFIAAGVAASGTLPGALLIANVGEVAMTSGLITTMIRVTPPAKGAL